MSEEGGNYSLRNGHLRRRRRFLSLRCGLSLKRVASRKDPSKPSAGGHRLGHAPSLFLTEEEDHTLIGHERDPESHLLEESGARRVPCETS